MELKDRERKVDVNKMSIEQADLLSVQLGKMIAKIMDDANIKCNELLNIYGLQTRIGYEIIQVSEKTEEIKKTKKTSKKQQKRQSLPEKI